MTEDGRKYVRIGKVLEFEYTTEGVVQMARIEDLSEGGAFVDSVHPLDEGTELEFCLRLPDGDEAISGKATVVWRQPTIGMGIRFVGLSEEERERIKFYVAAEFFRNLPSSPSNP